MLREYAKYLVSLASVILVILGLCLILGCGNSIDYPKERYCHEDCRIVFHLDNRMPCRDSKGNQLNLPTFASFHEIIVNCDSTSDKQKEVSQDLLGKYYKRYNIDTMLYQEYKPKPKPKPKGMQALQAVLIGITCGIVFGMLVFLPCYISDRKHR